MEVKERTLKESGSCPQIGRQQQRHRSPGLEIAPNRSTNTFLSQDNSPENRSMKRLSRTKRVGHNPSVQRSQQEQPHPPELIVRGRPCGDAQDYRPPVCYIPTVREKNKKPTANSRSSNGSSGLEIEKRHIDVIVRIRPKNRSEEMSRTMVWKTSEHALIFDPKEKNSDFFYKGKRQVLRNDFGKKRPNKNLSFGFDYVYGQESTNEEIFEVSLKGLINKVLTGFNCTVFAYGATGSGKTYTMLGSADQSSPGLSVLMAEELYRRLDQMENEDFSHDIKVSYLEVYNETIKDLFNPYEKLSIREDGKQGLRIPDLTVHKPSGPEELLGLLRCGNGNRSQHATDFNAESSRSHAVFEITILLHQHSPEERFKQRTATSRLFMVDLAGSEKGSVNIVDGNRLREGANINKSLLALSNCINALADGKQHIPYRDSKLTRLLKDSLSGNCVTVMIANISPAEITYEDTHNTLHYASRAKNIKVACKQNAYSEELIEDSESNSKITDLQNEVRMLAQALADERRKHQATREELMECQLGDGDGFGGDLSRRRREGDLGQEICRELSQQKKIFRSISEIPDPDDMAQLMDLLKRKTELVANLTDHCIQSRLVEWEMKWKKLQVDIAEMIGRPKTSDTEHFISITKLRNSQSDLEMTTHPGLTVEGTELEGSLKKINNEIESVQKTCLESIFLQQGDEDEEDYSLSFEEFIRHRSMDMELETMEKLVKFHQQLETSVFGELKNSQIHRFHLLQFIQRIVINLKQYQAQNKDPTRAGAGLWTKEMEKKFHSLLKPVYDSSMLLDPPPPLKRIDIREDFAKLENVLQAPVVTFLGNDPAAVKSLLQPPVRQISSELLPTTAANSSILKINETTSKDTYLSSDSEIAAVLRSPRTGNNASRPNNSKFLTVPESSNRKSVLRRQGHPVILPQVKEEEEEYEELGIIPESPPTSANTNEIEEDVFQPGEDAVKDIPRHHESFEISRSRSRRDNVQRPEHNITPTNAHNDESGGASADSVGGDVVIKQRGKDTRTKSYTNLGHALHRGKATTDLVHGESNNSISRSGGGSLKNLTSIRPPFGFGGGGARCQDKGVRGQDTRIKGCRSGGVTGSKQQKQQQPQKQQNERRIPRLKPLNNGSKSSQSIIPPASDRPFTFCYEESTSQSSFDNSFD